MIEGIGSDVVVEELHFLAASIQKHLQLVLRLNVPKFVEQGDAEVE